MGAFFQHRVRSPGFADRGPEFDFRTVLPFQLLNEFFDVLRPVFIADEQGVGGIDHDQVPQSHPGDEPFLALQDRV